MSIRVTCSNDHRFKVRDEHAGKRARCPTCHQIVPIPEDQSDQSEDHLEEPGQVSTAVLESLQAGLVQEEPAGTPLEEAPAATPAQTPLLSQPASAVSTGPSWKLVAGVGGGAAAVIVLIVVVLLTT